MKLAVKLVCVYLAGVLALLAAYGHWRVSRERAAFGDDMRRDAVVLGVELKGLLSHVWATSGEVAALRLIEEQDQAHQRVSIRWVWREAPAGSRHAPRASRATLALQWTTAPFHLVQPNADGTGALLTYVPVDVGSGAAGALELFESLKPVEDYVNVTVRRTLTMCGLVALVSGAAALVVGTWLIGAPISRLVAMTRRFGAGDLSPAPAVGGSDELAELGAALDDMALRLREATARTQSATAARMTALDQLRHADRLKTLGTLASTMAHELGAPLNTISGWASLIAEGRLPPQDVAAKAQVIGAECQRLTQTIRRLLGVARRGPSTFEVGKLAPVVDQSVDLVRLQAENAGVRIVLLPGGDDHPVRRSAGMLHQVLTNLLVNAVQSMPDGGEVHVSLEAVKRVPPGAAADDLRTFACVNVRDHGTGIAPEALEHVFEPFYSTKAPGEGTGLGLSIAQGIVEEHGGWIEVESAPGAGSVFRVLVPLEEPCRAASC